MRIFQLILISLFVFLASCKQEIKTSDVKYGIIFETDLFEIQVELDTLISFIREQILSFRDKELDVNASSIFNNLCFSEKFNLDTLMNGNNIYRNADDEVKPFLKNWASDFFRDSLTNIINKDSREIENQFILKAYDDEIGKSGNKLFIRDNYIFSTTEIIYTSIPYPTF